MIFPTKVHLRVIPSITFLLISLFATNTSWASPWNRETDDSSYLLAQGKMPKMSSWTSEQRPVMYFDSDLRDFEGLPDLQRAPLTDLSAGILRRLQSEIQSLPEPSQIISTWGGMTPSPAILQSDFTNLMALALSPNAISYLTHSELCALFSNPSVGLTARIHLLSDDLTHNSKNDSRVLEALKCLQTSVGANYWRDPALSMVALAAVKTPLRQWYPKDIDSLQNFLDGLSWQQLSQLTTRDKTRALLLLQKAPQLIWAQQRSLCHLMYDLMFRRIFSEVNWRQKELEIVRTLAPCADPRVYLKLEEKTGWARIQRIQDTLELAKFSNTLSTAPYAQTAVTATRHLLTSIVIEKDATLFVSLGLLNRYLPTSAFHLLVRAHRHQEGLVQELVSTADNYLIFESLEEGVASKQWLLMGLASEELRSLLHLAFLLSPNELHTLDASSVHSNSARLNEATLTRMTFLQKKALADKFKSQAIPLSQSDCIEMGSFLTGLTSSELQSLPSGVFLNPSIRGLVARGDDKTFNAIQRTSILASLNSSLVRLPSRLIINLIAFGRTMVEEYGILAHILKPKSLVDTYKEIFNQLVLTFDSKLGVQEDEFAANKVLQNHWNPFFQRIVLESVLNQVNDVTDNYPLKGNIVNSLGTLICSLGSKELKWVPPEAGLDAISLIKKICPNIKPGLLTDLVRNYIKATRNTDYFYLSELTLAETDIIGGEILKEFSLMEFSTLSHSVSSYKKVGYNNYVYNEDNVCKEIFRQIGDSKSNCDMNFEKKDQLVKIFYENCRSDSNSAYFSAEDLTILGSLKCDIFTSHSPAVPPEFLQQNMFSFDNCCLSSKQGTNLNTLLKQTTFLTHNQDEMVTTFGFNICFMLSIPELEELLNNAYENEKLADSILRLGRIEIQQNYVNNLYQKEKTFLNKCRKIIARSIMNIIKSAHHSPKSYCAKSHNSLSCTQFRQIDHLWDTLSYSQAREVLSNMSPCDFERCLPVISSNPNANEDMLEALLNVEYSQLQPRQKMKANEIVKLGSAMSKIPLDILENIDLSDLDVVFSLGVNTKFSSFALSTLYAHFLMAHNVEADSLTHIHLRALGNILCGAPLADLAQLSNYALLKFIPFTSQLESCSVRQLATIYSQVKTAIDIHNWPGSLVIASGVLLTGANSNTFNEMPRTSIEYIPNAVFARLPVYELNGLVKDFVKHMTPSQIASIPQDVFKVLNNETQRFFALILVQHDESLCNKIINRLTGRKDQFFAVDSENGMIHNNDQESGPGTSDSNKEFPDSFRHPDNDPGSTPKPQYDYSHIIYIFNSANSVTTSTYLIVVNICLLLSAGTLYLTCNVFI